ncbi:TPA: host cell division inhibitor Icd-like protein [Klebsiella variicola subsp. variicola]|nr:host cell division inhibitor Icd-like protein [Klebsiella variicola subsp. variicola]
MNKPTSTRTHLASFYAGDRDSGRAPYQQNNSLKNEGCVSGPNAGNSGVFKLAGFYGCLLVVIGNGADRQKKKGRILPFGTKALIRDLSHSDSLGFLRCRRLISPFAAVIRNPAVLSPSSFSFSISSKSSRGSLTESCRERLFFLPVAITETSCLRWCSVYTSKLIIKHLKWCSLGYTVVVFTLSTAKAQVRHKTAKPRGAPTPSGLLTTSDRISIEVAMSNRITPLTGRASLSPNLFLWRFLALNRHDKKARPCRLSVEAATEREARRILAPHFILSLAARLPVVEVRHV